MINAIYLGNFKAFAETQRIPLRPITLIFGPNSSGKSSIIHGLLLVSHAAETGDLDAYRTTIGGESVDLGGFRQYVHRRNITQTVKWGVEIDTAQLGGRLADLLAPVSKLGIAVEIGLADLVNNGKSAAFLPPSTQSMPIVKKFTLTGDGAEFWTGELTHSPLNRSPGTFKFDHPILVPIMQAIIETASSQPIPPSNLRAVLAGIAALLARSGPGLKFTGLVPGVAYDGDGPLSIIERFSLTPQSNDNPMQDIEEAGLYFLPQILNDLLNGLRNLLNTEFQRLRYLGPLRSYPPRQLASSQHYDPNWYAGGGYAWDVVRRNKEIRTAVNRWLGDPKRLRTPYRLEVRTHINQAALLGHLQGNLEYLLPLLSAASSQQPIDHTLRQLEAEIERSNLEHINELVLIDQRTNTIVSHRDIGIGVSQVLPVLVGAYGAENTILAVEQPEIHLHPALQAELGDVFIEAALGGRNNTFVLETHSEHLILRLMRRMRDTARGTLPEGMPAVRPEDVAIVYVEPRDEHSASIVQMLELDEEGQLLDPWPGGFFEEGIRERFT